MTLGKTRNQILHEVINISTKVFAVTVTAETVLQIQGRYILYNCVSYQISKTSALESAKPVHDAVSDRLNRICQIMTPCMGTIEQKQNTSCNYRYALLLPSSLVFPVYLQMNSQLQGGFQAINIFPVMCYNTKLNDN